ncbi:MAG: DUF3168 domain-containing protein [Tateyamaria sp.]|jgi:hypothetical protein|uniref:DUF3168 domain-containing protein n=1 Tax=Tateyamaria sp. TaxID=1929288 RepID=UPI0032DC803A
MTYAVSAALQSAVYAAVSADPGVAAIVGGAVYDALPSGTLPGLYVSLGPENVRVEDDQTGSGSAHRFVISVITDVPGFRAAKEAAGAVSDALHETDLTLSRGRLVSLRFQRARAYQIDKSAGRRIDLTFRARVEDN